MYYLHMYMNVYKVEELLESELKFGLLKTAILSLILKVVIMEDVINSVLHGLTIQEQLALFEVNLNNQAEAANINEADLYLSKKTLEDRVKTALEYEFTHESPILHIKNFF